MPTYMVQANYTAEAWLAMTQNPEDRAIAISKLLAALGSRLLSLYFTCDEYDIIVIYEAPNALTAHSAAIAAFAAGHLKESKTTELFSSQEAVAAMEKAGRLSFDKPSQ